MKPCTQPLALTPFTGTHPLPSSPITHTVQYTFIGYSYCHPSIISHASSSTCSQKSKCYPPLGIHTPGIHSRTHTSWHQHPSNTIPASTLLLPNLDIHPLVPATDIRLVFPLPHLTSTLLLSLSLSLTSILFSPPLTSSSQHSKLSPFLPITFSFYSLAYFLYTDLIQSASHSFELVKSPAEE